MFSQILIILFVVNVERWIVGKVIGILFEFSYFDEKAFAE